MKYINQIDQVLPTQGVPETNFNKVYKVIVHQQKQIKKQEKKQAT